MGKIGVALINLGTPDSVDVKAVRRYLLEFLLDKRVIDKPFIQRNFLVRSLIVPKRKKIAANLYAMLPKLPDLPLRYFGNLVAQELNKVLGENFEVELAMRYGNPAFKSLLKKWKEKNFEEIIILPLFPQYASATTGSVLELFFSQIKNWSIIPRVHIVRDFYAHPTYIKTQIALAQRCNPSQYDHIVFSYHGLPLHQLKKANIIGKHCQGNKACCKPFGSKNNQCYRAQCLQTTELISQGLSLDSLKVTTTFQSRLGKNPWIEPYTEEVIEKLGVGGIKRVLIFSPSFVSDCLETWIEIEKEYAESFIQAGGEKLTLVPSLNKEPLWIESLKTMILEKVSYKELSKSF
ncbi:ferrochelatase [Candidatus Aerophobetes bacterium]|uniref:Ferrochelatase n=1 Tax=Aerophobetes bacterium TaxID=2030807 RepID=A0A2A4WYS2_UNCAE|nr:MAG: ferrochelatase [Candidatus Aerophobetes bacterium]